MVSYFQVVITYYTDHPEHRVVSDSLLVFSVPNSKRHLCVTKLPSLKITSDGCPFSNSPAVLLLLADS